MSGCVQSIAVIAAVLFFGPVDQTEFLRHIMLGDRDAARVFALHDVLHFFRKLHLDFAYNLLILDDVDRDVRVYESKYAVIYVDYVVYLYNVFSP